MTRMDAEEMEKVRSGCEGERGEADVSEALIGTCTKVAVEHKPQARSMT